MLTKELMSCHLKWWCPIFRRQIVMNSLLDNHVIFEQASKSIHMVFHEHIRETEMHVAELKLTCARLAESWKIVVQDSFSPIPGFERDLNIAAELLALTKSEVLMILSTNIVRSDNMYTKLTSGLIRQKRIHWAKAWML